MKASGLAAILLVLTAIGAAGAEDSFAPAPEPDQWQQLSPDSRNELRRQYLENLPAKTRKKLRSHVKRFNALSSSEKQELCLRFEEDRGYLPPACQKLF